MEPGRVALRRARPRARAAEASGPLKPSGWRPSSRSSQLRRAAAAANSVFAAIWPTTKLSSCARKLGSSAETTLRAASPSSRPPGRAGRSTRGRALERASASRISSTAAGSGSRVLSAPRAGPPPARAPGGRDLDGAHGVLGCGRGGWRFGAERSTIAFSQRSSSTRRTTARASVASPVGRYGVAKNRPGGRSTASSACRDRGLVGVPRRVRVAVAQHERRSLRAAVPQARGRLRSPQSAPGCAPAPATAARSRTARPRRQVPSPRPGRGSARPDRGAMTGRMNASSRASWSHREHRADDAREQDHERDDGHRSPRPAASTSMRACRAQISAAHATPERRLRAEPVARSSRRSRPAAASRTTRTRRSRT